MEFKDHDGAYLGCFGTGCGKGKEILQISKII